MGLMIPHACTMRRLPRTRPLGQLDGRPDHLRRLARLVHHGVTDESEVAD